jgi:tRNA (adenine22-N1)-methyltransferase
LNRRFRLPPRLQAILSLRDKPADTLADIGTDHAYIPVAACIYGLAKRAIACDIKEGPLSRAAETIRAHELESRIDLRLGDGLAPLAPGEADCIVIAGIGGLNIIQILTEGLAVAQNAQNLILQPQRDIPKLRRALRVMGFTILTHTRVREKYFIYTVLHAQPK